MSEIEKKIEAAEKAAADAIEQSSHPDTQAMATWVKKSCWFDANTSFLHALECLNSDAREGDYNGARPADVRRWLARWTAVQNKFGLPALRAARESEEAAARAVAIAAEAANFRRVAGMDKPALREMLRQMIPPIERDGLEPISVEIDGDKISASCRDAVGGDWIFSRDNAGKWTVSRGPDLDYSGSKWEALN